MGFYRWRKNPEAGRQWQVVEATRQLAGTAVCTKQLGL